MMITRDRNNLQITNLILGFSKHNYFWWSTEARYGQCNCPGCQDNWTHLPSQKNCSPMTLYPWGRVFLWGQLLTLYHFRSRSWKLLPWIWSIGWGRRLKMGKISKTNHKNGRTSSCKFVHSSATFCHYGENSHILFNFFPWRDSSVTCFFVLSQITRASIEIWLSLYLFKKVKNSNKEKWNILCCDLIWGSFELYLLMPSIPCQGKDLAKVHLQNCLQIDQKALSCGR